MKRTIARCVVPLAVAGAALFGMAGVAAAQPAEQITPPPHLPIVKPPGEGIYPPPWCPPPVVKPPVKPLSVQPLEPLPEEPLPVEPPPVAEPMGGPDHGIWPPCPPVDVPLT